MRTTVPVFLLMGCVHGVPFQTLPDDEARVRYEDALVLVEEARDPRSCAGGDEVLRIARRADDASTRAAATYMRAKLAERCGEDPIPFYSDALAAADAISDPDETARTVRCRARVALGRARGERAAFERAVRDDPRCVDGYVNLAAVERRAGEHEAALANLRRVLAVHSDDLRAFEELALLHYQRGIGGHAASLDLAEVVCRQAQLVAEDDPRTSPHMAAVHNTWGLVKLARGEVVPALRHLERALALDDTLYEAQMNFAAVTFAFRAYDDAHRAYRRAVELDPESYDAIVGLGAALRALGRFDAAAAAYEEARGIDPTRPEAYFNLAVLLHEHRSPTTSDVATMRATLVAAKREYEAFLARAAVDVTRYAAATEDVARRCRPAPERVRRRTGREFLGSCRPGRLQLVEMLLDATE